MTLSKFAFITFMSTAIVSFSASAGELACTAIEKTADGKFTYQMNPSLRVLDEVKKPGAPEFDVSDATVAFSCIRKKVVAVENDVEVLQAGYGLMLANSSGHMVSYKLEDGQVSYDVISGELKKKTHKKIKKVLTVMQARLVFVP